MTTVKAPSPDSKSSESSGGIGEIIYYVVPIPSVILVANTSFGATSEIYLLGASVITLGLSLLIPLLRSRPLFRRMRQLSREISAEGRSTSAAASPPADDSASPAS